MQSNYSISVVIPTYNRAGLLIKAVESVLAQKECEVDEILVCDDGSTDNSKEKIAALNDLKIKWIDCGRNGRPAIPRNTGIRQARSNWIAFLDSDDTWQPDKLKTQIQLLKTTGCKAVCSNATKIKKGKEQSPYFDFFQPKIGFTLMLQSNKVICSSMVVERDLLLSAGMFPEEERFKAIEDYVLWLKISALSDIAYAEQALVNYHDEPAQSIRQADKALKEQRNIVFKEIVKWLPSVKPEIRMELENQVLAELHSLSDTSLKTKLWRFKNLLYRKLKL